MSTRAFTEALLETDLSTKAAFLRFRPDWKVTVLYKLEEEGFHVHVDMDADTNGNENRALIRADAADTPMFLAYKSISSMVPDARSVAMTMAADTPELLDYPLVEPYIDYRRIIRALAMDEHTRHLTTKQAVRGFFEDVYGEEAVGQLLALAPLSAKAQEAIAVKMTADDGSVISLVCSHRSRGVRHISVHGGPDAVAVPFPNVDGVIKSEFIYD